MIKHADKGGATAVMDRKYYDKILEVLNYEESHSQLQTDTDENEMGTAVKGLPKIHKSQPVIRGAKHSTTINIFRE